MVCGNDYAKALQAQAQQTAGRIQKVQEYGGDCALTESGLSSSIERARKFSMEASSLTDELRGYFGLAIPKGNEQSAQPPTPKQQIDFIGDYLSSIVADLNAVLRHLRS